MKSGIKRDPVVAYYNGLEGELVKVYFIRKATAKAFLHCSGFRRLPYPDVNVWCANQTPENILNAKLAAGI